MNIILVNYYTPIPEDFDPEPLIPLKDISGRCFELANESFLMNKTAANALVSMIKAAKQTGYEKFKINSAYRSKDEQDRIYHAAREGYSNKAGYSEHETGLAVDLDYSGAVPDETNMLPLDWIAEHCDEFGFILRYPEDKESYTGVRYEPWHFRYVGKRVAKYIKSHRLCLEEYFEEKYGIPAKKKKLVHFDDKREKDIWDFFMEKLDNPYGTAGLMGNLYAESGLQSNVLEYYYQPILGFSSPEYTEAVDNGTYENFAKDVAGYGLAQWTMGVRKKGLLDYAKSTGRSIGDLTMQLEYLWMELNNDYPKVLEILKTATDLRSASDPVLTEFERPLDSSEATKRKRVEFGKLIYFKQIDKEQFINDLNTLSLWREDISFLLMDHDTGNILYERNADKPRSIGSITKMMTAYVLMKYIFSNNKHLKESVTIDEETALISGSPQYSGGEYMKKGDSCPAEVLLSLSLVSSSCAATVALVKHFFKSQESFVEIMNEEAKNMNLTCDFKDVIGINPGTSASARDLAIICSNIIRDYPQILYYTSMKQVSFQGRDYQNTSALLRNNTVKGLDGFKTGTTPLAGNCYVSTAKRKNHRMISVVLNAQESDERYNETECLLEYGLARSDEEI